MANTKDTTTSTYKPSVASSSSKVATMATKAATRHRKIKLFKLYKFVGTTYREIRKYIPGLETTNCNDTAVMECINNYKKCFLEIYEKEDALEYFEVCGELAQNISRTLDLFKEISAIYTNMDEYYHRVCELLSIFIACELRLSVDSDDDLSLIASRIIFIIKRHLTQEDEEATCYNILLTLVYVPRLFNARQIVCNVFEECLSLKSHTGAATALPDKIYIMYIIVFYRWMSMKTQDHEKKHIIDMAEMFMKPMVSLCNNQLYVPYLPAYTTHRTATRTILCNLKSYQDLRTASVIDNAYKKLGAIVNLCDDDDVIVIDKPQETLNFSEIFAAVQLEPSKSSKSIIKHEMNTIIDSVDLTVDDETDTTESSIVIKYEKWLHNFQVMAKQYRESQTRLQRQNESCTGKVICLDSDDSSPCEEEEAKLQTTSPTKKRAKDNKTSDGKAAECKEKPEDLFADNYPLTVTPIHCNADLESSEVEDAEDVTKLSRRILPIPLQTYESKKSAASRSVIRESFHNTQDNKNERTTSKSRQEKHIHFSSSPLGPTPAYSKNTATLSQSTNIPAQSSEFKSFGGFDRYPTCSANAASSIRKQQERIAAAPKLFCDIFDRSQSSCGIFPTIAPKHFSGGDLFPSTTGRSAHSLLSPTGGFFDAQHKKRNKIHGLMQRRATLSCRSDFDDYMAALDTRDTGNNDKFKMHPGHGPFSHPFSKSPLKNSICSEVRTEPEIDPVPASSTSDYDIINRYQFQDEKLMKNCAVIIEPTAELLEYERKRDAMYNELLQKQRRKMELRAIEKLKEKERRRQEKEMKREQYLREQRETMEKLQRMKINSPFNETESSDNHQKIGSDKETVTERSWLIKDTTQDNRSKETNEIEQQKEHLHSTDFDSSDTERMPLRERIKRTRNTTKKKIGSQSSRIRKRRQSTVEALLIDANPTEQSILTKRNSEVHNYSEKFLASQNSGGRIVFQPTKPKSISGLTDSEVESVRAPSRNKRERRKWSCSTKLVEQTDSEIESEPRKYVEADNMQRQSPRLQRNMETEHNADLEFDKTIPTKLPRTIRGRPRKQNRINTMDSKQTKSDANKITEKIDIGESINKPECKENEATLSERTIVASIAKSLYSPASTVVDKPLASSDQEEILETLEDLLGKETRLPKTVVASEESSNISRGSLSNVNSAVKMVTVSETPPDLEVIENIVISEIQREMDANRQQIKERTRTASAFQNIIPDLNDKSSLDSARPHENQTYIEEDKHFRSIPKTENSTCKVGESLKKSAAAPHLQDTFNKSLQDLPPLPATVPNVAEPSTLPLLISRVESLNNPLEGNKALSPVIESRQSSILVTENILLSNGNEFLETSKTLDDNNMLPPLTSSLLTEVETSMIQADISDISPTSINIVIPTDEEDTTMPHNIDERSPVIDEVMNANLHRSDITSDKSSLESHNNEIAPLYNGRNAENIIPSASNNNGEDASEMGSPPYEPLRVSSDDDGDKQSTTTDESQSNVKGGSDTSEGDQRSRLTSVEYEKLDTEIISPTYVPIHVSSDDDEKKKPKVPNETSSKENVISENLYKSPAISFKTKASLKFPTTRKFKIKLRRINVSQNNISSENNNNLTAEVEDIDNITPIPSPSLDQEDCIVRSEDYNGSSTHFLLSPEALTYDNSIEAVNYRQSPIFEEFHSVVVERYEEDSDPLPTILKSSSSTKPKANPKTVTFNPLAEVIPISSDNHYDSRCIFDRDETPPPEGFYRDHDYDRRSNNCQQTIKLITPATRKHFNDDCYSNISTTEELCNLSSSSSSQESEDDQEEIDIVLASSKGQEGIRRNNVELQRVLLVPPDAFSPLSQNTSPEHGNVPVENAEILNDRLSQEKTGSQDTNGGIQMDNDTTNCSLPIYVLSDEVVNNPANNHPQSSDEERNVLVSTTYLANFSSPGSHLFVNTVQNSMMSPSEHEVTSTQETTYQISTIESGFVTSLACSVPVGENSSSANVENSALLQNNQVDTTNHSPDMCAQPSNFNENNCIGSFSSNMSTSTNDSTKDKDNLAINITGEIKANGYSDRLSPSTTTDNDESLPEKLENVQNPRLKAKEPKKIQHNSSKLKHRNPFIVRTAICSQKLPNECGQQHEKEYPNLDKIENTSTLNSSEMENSKILHSVTKESQKADNVYKESVNQENFEMVSNNTSESLSVAKVESLPKKKITLIRPKPYNAKANLEKSSILVNNVEDRVKNPVTKKKFVPIRPKPVDLQNASTNVQQATKRTTSNHSDNPMSKKVKRNLNVIDFQDFSYCPSKDVIEARKSESLGSNLEDSVLKTTTEVTHEIQTMVNELLTQENKNEKSNNDTQPSDIEDSTSVSNKKDEGGVKYSETKTKCKDNVDDLVKCNLDTNCSENNQADMEKSKQKVNRQNEPDSKKELKRKHETRIPETKTKSNGEHHMTMEPSKKERQSKNKTTDPTTNKPQKAEDSKGRDHKEMEDAKQESKNKRKLKDSTSDKTIREDSKRNTNQKDDTKMKHPKQEVHTRNKKQDTKKTKQDMKDTKQGSTQNEETPIKDGGGNVGEHNKDAIGKDKTEDINIFKIDAKPNDNKIMKEIGEKKMNQKENKKVKDLKSRDKGKCNTKVEDTKNSKLEKTDTKQNNAKIDNLNKELEQQNLLGTDSLKIDDTSKESVKRTHTHRDKEMRRKEADKEEPNKTGDGQDKSNKRRKRRHQLETSDTNKGTSANRRVSKGKNMSTESSINISTRSNTIIAVKMIPFAAVGGVKLVNICEDTIDVATETEVVKTTKNEIVGVKMVKVNNVNEDVTSSEVRPETLIGQKSKHVSHSSVDNSSKDAKKLNINLNSINKSTSTSASNSQRNSNTSITDTNLSSINKNSIPKESTNPLTKVSTPDAIMLNSSSASAAATVHARKRRKNSM